MEERQRALGNNGNLCRLESRAYNHDDTVRLWRENRIDELSISCGRVDATLGGRALFYSVAARRRGGRFGVLGFRRRGRSDNAPISRRISPGCISVGCAATAVRSRIRTYTEAHECQVYSDLNSQDDKRMHVRRIAPSQLKVKSIECKTAVARMPALVHSPPLHCVYRLPNSTLVASCHEVIERSADDK